MDDNEVDLANTSDPEEWMIMKLIMKLI
jgi:hypothetical protein